MCVPPGRAAGGGWRVASIAFGRPAGAFLPRLAQYLHSHAHTQSMQRRCERVSLKGDFVLSYTRCGRGSNTHTQICAYSSYMRQFYYYGQMCVHTKLKFNMRPPWWACACVRCVCALRRAKSTWHWCVQNGRHTERWLV